jgi:phosphoribosylformylglycinamidine synthase
VQSAVRAAAAAGLATAAHDCAEGGLAVTLAEACVSGRERMGCVVSLPAGPSPAVARADLTLFGEGPSRVVVAVEGQRAREFEALMAESAIPWQWIGTTGGERLRITLGNRTVIDAALETLERAWRTGFERHVS